MILEKNNFSKFKVVGVVLFTLSVLTACIEDKASENEGSELSGNDLAPYQVSTTDGTGSFILENDENVIAGYGCTDVRVYDEYANQIDIDLSNVFSGSKGVEYTYVFNDFFPDYKGSSGILYYKSSNYELLNLPLNEEIIVPYVKASLYKIVMSEDKFFVISSTNAYFHIFDSNLNKIADNSLFGEYKVGDSITLISGDYYVITSPQSCASSGSIKFLEL